MSEKLLTEQVQSILDSLEEKEEKLEEAIKDAEDKSGLLLSLFFSEHEYPEFEHPEYFWVGIHELSEQVGHAQFMVLEIENKRKFLVEKVAETKANPVETTPRVVVQSTPAVVQEPGGGFGYLAARTRAGAQKDIIKMQLKAIEQKTTPQIATEKTVLDILDFGRQLIPEFNRVHLYFQQCLDHLHFFNDDETKAFFHGELRTHLNKLTGIIRSFCRTVAEYRKSVLDKIKMELAKGMTAVVTARYTAEGKIPLSEFFKQAREARGPTEF